MNFFNSSKYYEDIANFTCIQKRTSRNKLNGVKFLVTAFNCTSVIRNCHQADGNVGTALNKQTADNRKQTC